MSWGISGVFSGYRHRSRDSRFRCTNILVNEKTSCHAVPVVCATKDPSGPIRANVHGKRNENDARSRLLRKREHCRAPTAAAAISALSDRTMLSANILKISLTFHHVRKPAEPNRELCVGARNWLFLARNSDRVARQRGLDCPQERGIRPCFVIS
jgi:hypothetical protein